MRLRGTQPLIKGFRVATSRTLCVMARQRRTTACCHWAPIDVSLRCKAMSGLGATADIGRRCGDRLDIRLHG